VLSHQRKQQLLTLPEVSVDDQLYNIYYFRTGNGFIFGSLMPLSDLEQSISPITTVTLIAGAAIGAVFILLLVILIRLTRSCD
jgi:hypothetical protein